MRSKSFIAVTAALLVLVLGCIGLVVYDNGRKDTIAEGITVKGVAIGGLEAAAAKERLNAELTSTLREPLTVEFKKRSFELTPEQAGVQVDVDTTVDLALDRSRDGNVLSRSIRGLTGGTIDEEVPLSVTYERRAVRDLVERVERKVEREPVDASVDISATGVEKVDPVPGREIAARKLRRAVNTQLTALDADRTVKVEARKLKPEVTTAELAEKYPSIVVVNRSSFQVSLYEDLKLSKTYTVAIGAAGFDTPVGRYAIQNKQVDPYWNVPMSDWAGSLAGQTIPPGPQNPLKARWMGIYNGAGFHGTDATYSLGSAASHGCVRMAIPDVIDLYDRVDVGTPVYIA